MFSQLLEFWWQYLLLAISCYLFSSINYSVIFSKLFKKDDVRRHGSGNAGTTNMFRVYGLLMGVLTFVCDCLKGVICCLVAKAVFKSFTPDLGVFAGYFAGLFAVIGHIFPIYYKLRGGKGYATSIGIGFAMQPVAMAIVCVPMLLIIILVDRMSIAALFTVLTMTILQWTIFRVAIGIESAICYSVICLLVFIAHRQNIVRIFTGKELPTGVRSKIFKKKAEPAVESELADDSGTKEN